MLFKQQKCVFSVMRHFVVTGPVNLAFAAKVCCSGAPHAAITLIAACGVPLSLVYRHLALHCKFIAACGLRINPSKGFTGFAAERYMPLSRRYAICYSGKLQGRVL
jgi:hypothetical protein